jgi:hypothetical protein
VFAFSLPAAIVFYFFVSNLYRIAQQYYITRSMYHGEDSLGGQLRKNREDSPKDSKSSLGKGGSGKGSNTKSSRSAKNNSKTSNPKKNGSSGAKKKSKTSTAAQTGAPGRNSSGRQASARASVQPKARKKKKR